MNANRSLLAATVILLAALETIFTGGREVLDWAFGTDSAPVLRLLLRDAEGHAAGDFLLLDPYGVDHRPDHRGVVELPLSLVGTLLTVQCASTRQTIGEPVLVQSPSAKIQEVVVCP